MRQQTNAAHYRIRANGEKETILFTSLAIQMIAPAEQKAKELEKR
jgi:hypothetical protein